MITVLKAAKLIDGTGVAPIMNAALVVEDDQIVQIGHAADIIIPAEARVIDLGDCSLIPGMIDAHLHFVHSGNNYLEWLMTPVALQAIRAATDAKALLEAGFTAVRSMGSPVDICLRDAVNEGTIPGPRIVASGRAISQTRGHFDIHNIPTEWLKDGWCGLVADGADECRKAARTVLRDGADVVKICTTGGGLSEKDDPSEAQFTVEEIKAITEEAHRVGRKVASHACCPEGVKIAIQGGVDTIEHGFVLDRETCQMMVDAGTPLTSTLSVGEIVAAHGAEHGSPEHQLKKDRARIKGRFESLKLAHDMGVKVALGTDFWGGGMLPFGNNACEFDALVRAGLSNMDALAAGTSIAAEVLGMEDSIGTLEVGKLADVVAVYGDPLEDISVLQQVHFVMKGGDVVVHKQED